MIPARYSHALFGLILSGIMSFVVSDIASVRTVGLVDGFAGLWILAWLPSWAVAFPTMLVVAPFTRKIVARLTVA